MAEGGTVESGPGKEVGLSLGVPGRMDFVETLGEGAAASVDGVAWSDSAAVRSASLVSSYHIINSYTYTQHTIGR